VNGSPFLLVEEVPDYLPYTVNTLREYARRREVPHLRRPNSRRILFRLDWLFDWVEGAELEVQELGEGGRIVRPIVRWSEGGS
jgi:hypothetical protein